MVRSKQTEEVGPFHLKAVERTNREKSTDANARTRGRRFPQKRLVGRSVKSGHGASGSENRETQHETKSKQSLMFVASPKPNKALWVANSLTPKSKT